MGGHLKSKKLVEVRYHLHYNIRTMSNPTPNRLKVNKGGSHVLAVLATADTDAIRHEDFEGVDHLVVPIVALVEGVIHPSNSEKPELALASEFGIHPQGWDGRPVVINHPQRDGDPVSANSPEVLEQEQIGQLFNTEIDGKKLKTEAWLNLEKIAELDDEETNAAIERIENGDIVEVSTGLFALIEPIEGEFDGESYSGVWRNVIPDHLAILPEGVIGACSIEDGCGAPRLNQTNDIRLNSSKICRCGGNIMPDPNTPVVNDSDDEPAPTPVESAKHDPEEDKKKKKKKKRSMSETFSAMMTRLNGLFRAQTDTVSDIDIRAALLVALEVKTNNWIEIIAVFDESVVYSEGFSSSMFERSFEIASEGGQITLGSEPVQVRPVTEFVPVTISEENGMKVSEKVDILIANEATHFSADDKDWLLAMSEEQLDKLTPIVAEKNSEETNNSNTEETPNADQNPSGETKGAEVKASKETPKEDPPKVDTPEEFIGNAPTEMQEVLNSGLRMHREKKAILVKGLVANSKCEFSEDELKKMDVDMLERLSRLGNQPDFSGQGGTRTNTAGGDDDTIPAPLEVFPLKRAS